MRLPIIWFVNTLKLLSIRRLVRALESIIIIKGLNNEMTEMWKVIIKNVESTDYMVDDLGISVPAYDQINFHEQFRYDEIAGSDDLRTAISGSYLIVNNGVVDLNAYEGVDYLTLENLKHLSDNYYSKTELSTAGQAQIHWDNITDAPTISGGTGGTLDQSYDFGGAGAGRSIIVDAGTVKLDATVSGSYAPLELTELPALPVNGLAGGQLGIQAGILYVYDSSRSKWLSIQRMFLTFGKRGKSKNQYLAFGAGDLYSNNSGYRLARNATIISITGQLDKPGTCDIKLLKNDTLTAILTLPIISSTGNQNITVNVDLNASDYLQSYVGVAAPQQQVDDPIVIVEIAWRG